MELDASKLVVEPKGESSGHCDCCGMQSRTVWGFVHKDTTETVACYYLAWTVGQPLTSHPANFDLILGAWGEGTSAEDRRAVSLVHFQDDDGPGVTVIDATDRDIAGSDLVGSAARRDDVVGTPLATAAFAIFDAVIVQDQRLQQA